MKTVLLLGGFGFIGTNIIKYIDCKTNSDYQFIVFDRNPVHPHNVTFKTVKKVYYGDFRNIDDVEIIFKENKIDFIIHSISMTVPATSNNNIYDIESNLIPTINILNLQVKYNVKNIIFISSGGAIYGDKSIDSISEEILPNPISSYGIIKYTIEKYLYLYHKQNSINYLILRLSNPYGPYHYSEKQGVINVALRKAFANDLFYVWGNGLGAKDYIYIEDFCKIIFLLVEKPVINEVYNIGSGKSYSLNYILNCIKNKNHGFKWEYSKANDNDVKNVSLNINKLLNIIPDFNFTTLEEGLSLTSEWIKNQTRY